MIKYLTEAEKQLSRDLWEEAFPEDSRQFDDYYYRNKVRENRILALTEETVLEPAVSAAEVSAAAVSAAAPGAEAEMVSTPRQIDAMVQLNPYLVQAGSCRWQTDYLVGVATRKNRRHRGYMHSLLLQMMEDMREDHMPFCFLMPAAEAIYRPFGFTYIFDQPRWRLKDSAEKRLRRRKVAGGVQASGAESSAEQDAVSAAAWMMNWLQSRYQVFAVRDEAYVETLLKELASENGALEALYDGDGLAGFQAMWGLAKKEQRLLYAEASYIEEAAEPKPAIMARIITPEEFVRAVRLKAEAGAERTACAGTAGAERERQAELTVNLWLEDPLISRNQGLWLWHLNQETSWMERGEEPVFGQPQIKLTITELTSWLFGYSVPEAARELNKKIETLQGVFLDEVV